MLSIDFVEFPLWLNGLILTGAGVVVWLAGTKLARLADAISRQTKLTHVLAGALLLGIATSLPEIATTVTAGALGNAPLAVNNIFGGVAMQLAVLALIDFHFVRRGPLTFMSPDPVLLLGGVLLVLQIALSILAISVGDVTLIAQVGGWPILLATVYGLSQYFMNRFAESDTWTPARRPDNFDDQDASAIKQEQKGQDSASTISLVTLFVVNSLLVLAGGWAVSTSADALGVQTGIAGGFIGATLVAITTSLPEISTTASAVKLGAYTMAFSNIFGTNSLEVALLLPADIAYRDGPVINAIDQSSLLMAAVGIIMTSLYLWGLLERRDKSFLRMGTDSWWVVLTYLAGLILLYIITA